MIYFVYFLYIMSLPSPSPEPHLEFIMSTLFPHVFPHLPNSSYSSLFLSYPDFHFATLYRYPLLVYFIQLQIMNIDMFFKLCRV